MIAKIHEALAKKWITTRLAASEFYFKKPLAEDEEYAVMTTMVTLAFIPLGLAVMFTYARLVKPVTDYATLIFLIMTIFIGRWVAGKLMFTSKRQNLVERLQLQYVGLPEDRRKKYYSFKNVTLMIFLCMVIPWLVAAIIITGVCLTTSPR